MKKKTIALLLCVAALLALCACTTASTETVEAAPEPDAEPVSELVVEELAAEVEPEPAEEPDAASEEPMLNEFDLRDYVELFDLFTTVEEDIDEEAVAGKDESIAGTPLVDNDRVIRSVTVDLSGVDYTKTGEYDAVYTIVIDRDAYDIAEAECMAEARGEPAEAIEDDTEDAELVEDEPVAEEAAVDVMDDADADTAEELPEEFNAEEAIVIKHVTILTENEFNELAEQEEYTLNENGLLVKANPTDDDMAAAALAEMGVDVNDENVTLETSVNDEGQTVVKAVVTDGDGNKTTTEAVVDNRTGNVSVKDDNGNQSVVPVATPTPVPATKPADTTTPATPVTPAPTAAPTPQPTATPAPTANQDDDGHPHKSKDDDTTPSYTDNTGNEGGPDDTHINMGPGDDTELINSGSSSADTTTPATPTPESEHTHSWKPVYGMRESTIYYPEQQITGYTDGDPIYGTEEVWVGTWTVCNGCGQKFATANEWCDHNDTCGSYHLIDRYETQTVIIGYEQVPVYSEVQVPHTFVEDCIDYYVCAICGATKPNE